MGSVLKNVLQALSSNYYQLKEFDMAKKILVAMDASEHAMKAAGYVAETLKGCKDVKITLFSVIPEVSAAFKLSLIHI